MYHRELHTKLCPLAGEGGNLIDSISKRKVITSSRIIVTIRRRVVVWLDRAASAAPAARLATLVVVVHAVLFFGLEAVVHGSESTSILCTSTNVESAHPRVQGSWAGADLAVFAPALDAFVAVFV